jgi:hypothetical protein
MMNDEMNARVIGFKFHVSSLMMTCIRVYLSTCVLANLSTCLLVYLSTCLLVYLFTDLLHRLEKCRAGKYPRTPLRYSFGMSLLRIEFEIIISVIR